LSPAQLIQAAKERGLSAIALTDHDTINGLEEAEEAAKKLNIRFIPGIEMDIRWEPGEFHLLGLGIHRIGEDFRQLLVELKDKRDNRNLQILDRMHELSIEADYEEVKALSGGGSVGRPHFAALLVQRGVVKNRQQAFSRYLGKGRLFYVPKPGLEFDKALDPVHNAGGIPVLAHPMSLYVAWGSLPELVANP